MSAIQEPTLASRMADYKALAKSYWKSVLEKLNEQTEEFSGHISADMHHKIHSWKLDKDQEEAYKLEITLYIIQSFVDESHENDRAFTERVIHKNLFMLELWVEAGFSLFQLESDNHEHILDSLRELRAHRRAKEIRFDHFMDRKRLADAKFRDEQLAAGQ